MDRFQQPQYLVPIHGKWRKIKDNEIDAGVHGPKQAIDYYVAAYQKNPLAFFLPHGSPNKTGNDGLAFMNDWEHDLTLLRAPSQTGKTFHGAGKMGFYAGKCDPEWLCFKEHGLTWRQYPGNTELIVASFSWDNVDVVWNTYRKIWPREWLGDYSLNWGCFPGETGRQRTLSFGDGKPKKARLPFCTITFLCYTQGIAHWESRQADAGHLDEQSVEEKFDSLRARMLTRGDFTPIWSTTTPFLMKERPLDSGANGWMKKKLIDADEAKPKGCSFAEYVISMDSVPEEIIGVEKKQSFYEMHVTGPEAKQDDKAIRAGRSKYYGEWEVGGGIVLSAWNPEIHMITPFDIMKHKPNVYRMIDHGENPCAALLIAIMPWGDAIAFKEYYEYGRSMKANSKGIVEDMTGNTIEEEAMSHDFEDNSWQCFTEKQTGMYLAGSEMDPRSFGQAMKESGRTVGQAYNQYGLTCSTASGRKGHTLANDGAIDLLREAFELDADKEHINKRLGQPLPRLYKDYNPGAPSFYLFNTLRHFKGEIEGWTYNPRTLKPMDKDDHLISSAKFFFVRPRDYSHYLVNEGSFSGESAKPSTCGSTGY